MIAAVGGADVPVEAEGGVYADALPEAPFQRPRGMPDPPRGLRLVPAATPATPDLARPPGPQHFDLDVLVADGGISRPCIRSTRPRARCSVLGSDGSLALAARRRRRPGNRGRAYW